MKKLYSNLKVLFLYILSTISLFVYLYGFFPFQNSFQNLDPQPARRDDNDFTPGRNFHKLVLMVIDSIRYDFVAPENDSKYMHFTTLSVIENKSCLIKVRAQSPTVTMPRLKAITSGVNPTYFDVISNFMGSELRLDNFIKQGVQNKFKIVFYGDDTWIKLFPNKFIRSEGTSSFFASDYFEVDNNVTRHLDDEFKRKDWDFLILHYLGLDHIGHMEGPKSPLVEPKLKEMDSIIYKIFSHLKEMEKTGIKSLFLVTGDHGMKDSGGHGGATYPEVIIPLVSVGNPCNQIPGWPEDYVAEQIDLAPTISTAFGLPIPNSNVGKIIPALLSGVDLKTVLDIMEMNKKTLNNQASHRREGFNENSKVSKKNTGKNDVRERVEMYFNELSHLSDQRKTVSEYNVTYLILSLTVMWIILIVVTLHFSKFARPRKLSQYFLLLGTFLHGASFISTSLIEEEHQTWYFFWTTLCLLYIYENLNYRIFNLRHIKNILPWVGIVIIHRFLRKLNQTGDKWAMLPDIKSYLAENPTLLNLVYFTGVFGLLYCALTDDLSFDELSAFCSALFFNICYRLSVSSINLEFMLRYPKSRGQLECAGIWIFTSVFAIQSILAKKSAYLFWSLIASTLLKPHNVILVPMEIITSRCIRRLYQNTDEIWTSFAHFWMGYVFYFYQGNGNSIANVDVSAGFVGLEEYNPVYSFIMIAVHTNSSHVLSFLLGQKHLLSICLLRLISLTIYCTFLVFQLNHLFIWSVFSPKLLYETNFHLVFLILMSSYCVYLKYSGQNANMYERYPLLPSMS